MGYCAVYVYEATFQEAQKKLEGKVNLLCKAGWKPQGGVSLSVTTQKYSMAQAMVRNSKKA